MNKNKPIYCLILNIKNKQNQNQNEIWENISKMIPGKSKESCIFKWLKLNKSSVQSFPWTEKENRLLPEIFLK